MGRRPGVPPPKEVGRRENAGRLSVVNSRQGIFEKTFLF